MKVKKINWRRGHFGLTYGWVGKVHLFTIEYGSENYALTSTLSDVYRQHAPSEQGCQGLAHALLSLHVANLVEKD